MIFKQSRTVREILCLAVLLLQFVLLTNYAFATSTPPREVIGQLSARKWDKNLVSLLEERLTLAPAGFWISGARAGDYLYGVAVFPRPSEHDLRSALQMQATKVAFYDIATFPALYEQLSPTLREELHSYLLLNEITYQINKMEETTYLPDYPAAYFVQFRYDQAQFQQQTSFDQDAFAQFLFEKAVLWRIQGEDDQALGRIDWILQNIDDEELVVEAILTKAQLLFEQEDFDEACITVLPLLDYSERDFFQLLTPGQVSLILSVFAESGFPELGIDLAAMALVLYPENLKFEEQLIHLLELEEGMGR